MGESRTRRFLEIGAPVPGRLETQFEYKHGGFRRNAKTGALEPIIKTMHIGHGQQLARKRLAEPRVWRPFNDAA